MRRAQTPKLPRMPRKTIIERYYEIRDSVRVECNNSEYNTNLVAAISTLAEVLDKVMARRKEV